MIDFIKMIETIEKAYFYINDEYYMMIPKQEPDTYDSYCVLFDRKNNEIIYSNVWLLFEEFNISLSDCETISKEDLLSMLK